MKCTGIIRRVDELGRIVIPIEIREILQIKEKTPMEIFRDGNKIILQKFEKEKIGIVRKVDKLGRVVIPIEIREILQIEEKTPMEIFIDGNNIILKKFEETCSFCNNIKDLIKFDNGMICQDCICKIKEIQ